MEARVSEVKQEDREAAEALGQALLKDPLGDAYMRDDRELDDFLIDGCVDLVFVAREFSKSVINAERKRLAAWIMGHKSDDLPKLRLAQVILDGSYAIASGEHEVKGT